jgi:hypothetical protein
MTTNISAGYFQTKDELADAIRDQLHKGVVDILFTKADGTTRLLKGTLKADLLPKVEEDPDADIKPKRKQSDAVIVAFDIEKQEFRSFKKDSVIEFTYKNEG